MWYVVVQMVSQQIINLLGSTANSVAKATIGMALFTIDAATTSTRYIALASRTPASLFRDPANIRSAHGTTNIITSGLLRDDNLQIRKIFEFQFVRLFLFVFLFYKFIRT